MTSLSLDSYSSLKKKSLFNKYMLVNYTVYLVKPNHFVKCLFYWAQGNVKKRLEDLGSVTVPFINS